MKNRQTVPNYPAAGLRSGSVFEPGKQFIYALIFLKAAFIIQKPTFKYLAKMFWRSIFYK
jgi:hypothetical protein